MDINWPAVGCIATLAIIVIRATIRTFKGRDYGASNIDSPYEGKTGLPSPPPTRAQIPDQALPKAAAAPTEAQAPYLSPAPPASASAQERGLYALARENWPIALKLLEEAVTAEPTLEARLGLAEVYLRYRRFDDALAVLENARLELVDAKKPEDYRLYLLQGQVSFAMEAYPAAQLLFRKAEQVLRKAGHSDDPLIIAWRVRALLKCEMHREADSEYERIRYLSLEEPYDADQALQKQMAILTAGMGRIFAASDHLKLVETLRQQAGLPLDPDVLFARGMFAGFKKQYKTATGFFIDVNQKLQQAGLPLSTAAELHRARMYFLRKRFREGLKILEHADSLIIEQHEPVPLGLPLLRGKAYYNLKQRHKGVEYLESALELAQLRNMIIRPEYLGMLARMQHKLGNRERACLLMRMARGYTLLENPKGKCPRWLTRLEKRLCKGSNRG